MQLRFLVLLLFLTCSLTLSSQTDSAEVIQFSGLVMTEEEGELVPLPYANILLSESGRGTFSDFEGFFSIVALKGEKVVFSSVGYATVEFIIPDTLTEKKRYTIYQIMTRDTLELPTAVVYPWPSREHFKIEFLALEVPEDYQDRAEANLANASLERLRENMPTDGYESGGYYLRRQAESYYSFGQSKPIHVLNPIAWAKFFKAWKNGDFKRKKDKE